MVRPGTGRGRDADGGPGGPRFRMKRVQPRPGGGGGGERRPGTAVTGQGQAPGVTELPSHPPKVLMAAWALPFYSFSTSHALSDDPLMTTTRRDTVRISLAVALNSL